jgi:hypothetical protein
VAEVTELFEYPGAAAIARMVSLTETLMGAEYMAELAEGVVPSVV